MRSIRLRSLVLLIAFVGGAFVCAFAGRFGACDPEALNSPASKIATVREIYAPEALIAFARDLSDSRIDSQELLTSKLRSLGLENAWYALVVRSSSRDGTILDERIVDYPGRMETPYGRIRSVLYALAGGQELWGSIDPTALEIVIIPEAMRDQHPDMVIANLVDRSPPTKKLSMK